MREHVRPFTAGAGRHSRTHCARKSSIESQATGSESRGEIVNGGAAVWGSGEIQSEKKDGSGRESREEAVASQASHLDAKATRVVFPSSSSRHTHTTRPRHIARKTGRLGEEGAWDHPAPQARCRMCDRRG